MMCVAMLFIAKDVLLRDLSADASSRNGQSLALELFISHSWAISQHALLAYGLLNNPNSQQ